VTFFYKDISSSETRHGAPDLRKPRFARLSISNEQLHARNLSLVFTCMFLSLCTSISMPSAAPDPATREY
jgi:hypothetical protein